MNKQRLMAQARKLSEQTGVHMNALLSQFFMEMLLARIGSSKHRDFFIFKGGFLLSTVFGISQRTTLDMDFLLQGMPLEEAQVRLVFGDILGHERDGITCRLLGLSPIRGEDAYGGWRLSILCQLDNIRLTLPLDLATGDPITPSPVAFDFVGLFLDRPLSIIAYNMETVLAEKLHTLAHRGLFNSRSKDFYDIYMIAKQHSKLNTDWLRSACQQTFAYRSTSWEPSALLSIVDQLSTDPTILSRWQAYAAKSNFAKDLSMAEVMLTIRGLVQQLA